MISLERFTELSKVVILIVMVYYKKGIQIKISKGRRHIEQSPIFCLFSPSGIIWRALNSLSKMRDKMYGKMYGILPTRESHLSFPFFFDSVGRHGTPMWLTLVIQTPVPMEVILITPWSKVSTINQGSQVYRITLIRQDMPRSQRLSPRSW